jgi:DNA topoisomerase VI subunit B
MKVNYRQWIESLRRQVRDKTIQCRKLEAENAELRRQLTAALNVGEEWHDELKKEKARWENVIPRFEQKDIMKPKTGWLKPIHITDIRRIIKELSGKVKK